MASGVLALFLCLCAGTILSSIAATRARRAEAREVSQRTAILRALTLTIKAPAVLAELSGLTDVRREWYRRSDEAVRACLESAPSKLGVETELLLTDCELGLSVVDFDTGDFEAARPRRERALQRRLELARRAPENPQVQAALSYAWILWGDYEKENYRVETERAAYLSAHAIIEALARKYPENRCFASDLNYSYERLGALELDLGDPVRGREYIRLRDAATRTQVERYADATALRDRAQALIYTELERAQAGDEIAVRTACLEATKCLERLVSLDPTNIHNCGLAYNYLSSRARQALQDGALAAGRQLILLADQAIETALAHSPQSLDAQYLRISQLRTHCAERRAARDLTSALALAQDAWQRSAAILAQVAESRNAGALRIQALDTLIEVERASGDLKALRGHTEQIREAYCRPAEKRMASAIEVNCCVRFLLTCDFEDLRDPVHALRLSEQLVLRTGNFDLTALINLARAQEACGQLSAALETATRATRHPGFPVHAEHADLEALLSRLAR